MFDHVVLRRAESGSAITSGQIAEALLFYQKVHLVVDRMTLLQLLNQIGPSSLVALTQRSDFSAVYTEETLATMTNSVGVSKVHDFGAITFSGDQKAGTLATTPERLQYELERCGVSRSETKKFTQAFLRRVPVRKLSGNHFVAGGVPSAARADLADAAFFKKAVSTILRRIPGGYEAGKDLKLEVLTTDLGNFVFENIDFAGMNARRAAMNPPLEPLTLAHILSHIQDARADFILAAHYGGDFVTSAVTSAVVQIRFDALLHRTSMNTDAQRQFSEIVLPDMPTIAEAVDSGERSFDEFLRLLDKADRFKSWLKSANPDEGLTREYLHAVTSQDWIQTTKAKGVRYLFSLAADACNPIAGLASGLIDNFLIEKLLGGWRPNHFVNDRLAPFLSEKSKQ